MKSARRAGLSIACNDDTTYRKDNLNIEQHDSDIHSTPTTSKDQSYNDDLEPGLLSTDKNPHEITNAIASHTQDFNKDINDRS